MSKEEKFKCKKCSVEIGGHNQFLHDGMCDNCFFDEYFPEDAQIFETNIEQMRKHCRSKSNERENQKLLKFLKSGEFDQDRFQKIVQEIMQKIDCTKCSNCCKELKLLLNEKDMGKISKHLNLFFSNIEICPIVFNVLENAKEEFLEDIYAFENPD